MKKTVLWVLCLALAFALAGCVPGEGPSRSPDESPTDTSPADTQTPDTQTPEAGGEDDGDPADATAPAASNPTAAALTPKDATVVVDEEGMLSLICKQSFTELIAFYQAAIAELGAEELKTETGDGTWSYVGKYGDDKTISLQVRETGDKPIVVVIY